MKKYNSICISCIAALTFTLFFNTSLQAQTPAVPATTSATTPTAAPVPTPAAVPAPQQQVPPGTAAPNRPAGQVVPGGGTGQPNSQMGQPNPNGPGPGFPQSGQPIMGRPPGQVAPGGPAGAPGANGPNGQIGQPGTGQPGGGPGGAPGVLPQQMPNSGGFNASLPSEAVMREMRSRNKLDLRKLTYFQWPDKEAWAKIFKKKYPNPDNLNPNDLVAVKKIIGEMCDLTTEEYDREISKEFKIKPGTLGLDHECDLVKLRAEKISKFDEKTFEFTMDEIVDRLDGSAYAYYRGAGQRAAVASSMAAEAPTIFVGVPNKLHALITQVLVLLSLGLNVFALLKVFKK